MEKTNNQKYIGKEDRPSANSIENMDQILDDILNDKNPPLLNPNQVSLANSSLSSGLGVQNKQYDGAPTRSTAQSNVNAQRVFIGGAKPPMQPSDQQSNVNQQQQMLQLQQMMMQQQMKMGGQAQMQQGQAINPQQSQQQAMMMMMMQQQQQGSALGGLGISQQHQQQQQQLRRPPIELTPEEVARRKRREEERKKFKRFIPLEDPKNLEVEGGYQSTLFKCGECCGQCGLYCPCCSNPQVQVNNSFKGIYERFGKYVKTVDSGMHFVNPCTDQLIQIDCKTQNIDLGLQSALTKDNIMLFVHGVVQYRVVDCRQAHYTIVNTDYSVKELSICALRCIISQFNYQNLLDNRELFKRQMEEFVDEYIHDWGVDVEQIIIKDMNMDPKISELLSSAAKEVRLAQAKILNAKADVAAAEQQMKAAEQLASKSAMQIRFLSTLERIASKSKVVFLGE